MKKLFLLFFSALLCTAVSAHDFKVDGIYYNITSSSDLTVAVTYRGRDYNDYSNEYSGSVVIPEKVTYNSKEYSVTSIGDDAFMFCSGLTSVTIPNSVTCIGEYAFSGCSGLTAVHIADLSAWCKIKFSGYVSNPTCYADHLYLNGEEIINLVIHDDVTSIGDYAFAGCSGLTSVTIPSSVTSIGDAAFAGCSGLASIKVESGNTNYDSRDKCNAIIETATNTLIAGCKNTVIPNSVTSIGNYVFEGCSGLTSVTIPNSVTSIGVAAFAGCSGLTSVTIPNSVTSIGEYAFNSCSGLTSVTIPNSVTSIGNYAFEGCSGMTAVHITDLSAWCKIKFGGWYSNPTYYAHHLYLNGEEITDLNIPDSIPVIHEYAFSGCNSLRRLTIPESCYHVRKYAFLDCNNLQELTLPSTLISCFDYSFKGCTSLQKINCQAETPPYADTNTFSSNIYTKATLNVPEGCADKYKSADCWKEFTTIRHSGYIEVKSITLDKTTAELTEGETLTLTATVTPENATDNTVVWTSSDETVATVANGVVTALKAGKATITAKVGEVSATCELTVNAKVIPATGIALDKTTAELTEGETLTLTATVTPENATDKTITWTSSDESIAKVSETGVVTALKAGKVTITASSKVCPTVTATCEITVNTKISAITLNKTAADIVEGESLVLTATVSPEDATDKSVTWISSDESIAKISENGVVTALKAGIAIITASSKVCPTVTATCEVVVKAKTVTVTGITLDKTTAEITEGETLTLTATVSPENATDKTVTWISSDESIVKVINGIVIGVKAGKATIIASCGDKVATCEITVNAKVIPTTGITLDKTTAEMIEGETLTLTATVTPEDATDKTVVWTSSDETVATVKDGVVTALKAGKATITAKAGEVSATCDITVNAKVIPATGIALDKTTAELTEGETLTLTATVTPEDATDKTVAWTSSDETVATVKDGVVIALKAGKATITAKSGEVSATCELTVNAKVIPATGITLDKTTAEMTEGETLTLTATVTPEDATDKTVVWTSSDETVATVANGVVTALKAGKATITAKVGEVSATCEITVNAKVIPVTGISLDKTTAEMIEGETLSLTATVTPEHATDKTVTWASSDEAVVKVVNGVVSALKTGKATITATSGDVSATCEITVIPVTGINGVIYSDGYAAGNVYTVAGNLVCRKGEKLSNLPKGLYIVDGKKIVVK